MNLFRYARQLTACSFVALCGLASIGCSEQPTAPPAEQAVEKPELGPAPDGQSEPPTEQAEPSQAPTEEPESPPAVPDATS